MAEQRPPIEANPVILVLAEIAVDVVRRRRSAAERRAKITVVEGGKRKGGQAA